MDTTITQHNINMLFRHAGRLDLIVQLAKKANQLLETDLPSDDRDANILEGLASIAMDLSQLYSPSMSNDLSFLKDLYNRTQGP